VTIGFSVPRVSLGGAPGSRGSSSERDAGPAADWGGVPSTTPAGRAVRSTSARVRLGGDHNVVPLGDKRTVRGEVPATAHRGVGEEPEDRAPRGADTQTSKHQPGPRRARGEHAHKQSDYSPNHAPGAGSGERRPPGGHPPGDLLDQTQVRANDLAVLDRKAVVGQVVDRPTGVLVAVVGGKRFPRRWAKTRCLWSAWPWLPFSMGFPGSVDDAAHTNGSRPSSPGFRRRGPDEPRSSPREEPRRRRRTCMIFGVGLRCESARSAQQPRPRERARHGHGHHQ
jgi:hypothetical protein